MIAGGADTPPHHHTGMGDLLMKFLLDNDDGKLLVRYMRFLEGRVADSAKEAGK
jgi:hypothetical protein